MDKKIEIKNNLGSCRIKVNKMLSTLKSNWNIFIPKYTLSNRNEEKYLSHLNKTKEIPKKISHNKINNIKNINIKKKSNRTTINSTINTTEDNYTKQPIDFIINHGVLVYQRNFKGEEIINFGVNRNKKRFCQENKKIETELNNKAIEKNRQKLKIPKSFDLPEHKKSNSIVVNKIISSNTSSSKELPKNFRKNNNLSFLLTNKLKFFSKDKDKDSNNNTNDTRESELYRDSQSLQKKYEQICRRKKKDMTLTFTRKFKDKEKDINSVIENNYLSDFNKTNSFSNFNDNNSINSMKMNILDHRKKYSKMFYKNSPLESIDKYNENENDETKDKNMIKIKLIKSNNIKNRKTINYRLEKYIPKTMSKDMQDNFNIHNLSEIRKKKALNKNDNNDDKILPRKKSYVSLNDKTINDYLAETNSNISNDKNINVNNTYNNKLNTKTFTFAHKRNYLLGNKNNLKIKEIYNIKRKTKSKSKNKTSSNSNKKIYISHTIKNICTKDKRIFIHINYITQILNSKHSRYNNSMLSSTNIMNYSYIGLHQRNKSLLKRNEFEKKLSLIKEEDEKSKYLNSTNSVKFIDEDELYNSTKTNMKHIRILKDRYGYHLSVPKIVNAIEKSWLNRFSKAKKDFLLKLKVIYFDSTIKRIFHKKLRFTNFGKLLQKKGKNKMIYYPKINRPKMKKKIHKMSNINSKNKADNERNELTSRSVDLNKDCKIIELSGKKEKKYCRNNFINRDKIFQLLSKTEIKKS